ncbi:hypothetical protein M0L20_29170 [Spirosoma sp. RP8]|uniref:Uncharacterized protein n=1 Tax=Spirosoma liriopis TaxID=2937440 RepID=A0ABT0HV37_9BACT|nr:hypothetical protein [Spirosoma liriopis]MCK8495972.1 hypothetical protein [Spirosoma liriopis]
MDYQVRKKLYRRKYMLKSQLLEHNAVLGAMNKSPLLFIGLLSSHYLVGRALSAEYNFVIDQLSQS